MKVIWFMIALWEAEQLPKQQFQQIENGLEAK